MPSDFDDGSDSAESDFEDDYDDMAELKVERASSDGASHAHGGNGNKVSKPTSKANAKDANRPKRKKARRACWACQRAHLTCGDERPCNRCVKRGLAEQCADGMRKKAKYLHDAPAEALMPQFAGNYSLNGSHSLPSGSSHRQAGSHGLPTSQAGQYLPQVSNDPYAHFSSASHRSQMGPPIVENVNAMGDYTTQANLEAPAHFYSSSPQQISPVQSLSNTMDHSSMMGNVRNPSFEGPLIDLNDPSLLNFNSQNMNYENHYAALELRVLGQLSSGAVNTPELDVMGSFGQPNQGSISYDGFASGFGYGPLFQPWQGVNSRHNSSIQPSSLNNSGVEAFAVGETTGSIADISDYSQGQDLATGFSSTTISPELTFAQADDSQDQGLLGPEHTLAQGLKRKRAPFPDDYRPPGTNKRRRDTSEIYKNVQQPYPYTQGFHNLINFLNNRFSSGKVLRIAKALASFRPSFISCNKNLNADDLIFMEQCFQVTLREYLDFINCYGTPTIICRRTGEVAAVSKEFSLVTGWRRDVLLGSEPNLNVNTGGLSSGSETGASSKGTVTPRVINHNVDPGRPQPVFLAELIDQDSTVQFYEDFAELAFGASRSSIIGAQCTLLKYKTKNDPGWAPENRLADDSTQTKTRGDAKTESLMRGEAGTNTLGGSDGRVDAVLSWTVKRDTFDIPMMIVINFLPII